MRMILTNRNSDAVNAHILSDDWASSMNFGGLLLPLILSTHQALEDVKVHFEADFEKGEAVIFACNTCDD